jgi:hypothetical protein
MIRPENFSVPLPLIEQGTDAFYYDLCSTTYNPLPFPKSDSDPNDMWIVK